MLLSAASTPSPFPISTQGDIVGLDLIGRPAECQAPLVAAPPDNGGQFLKPFLALSAEFAGRVSLEPPGKLLWMDGICHSLVQTAQRPYLPVSPGFYLARNLLNSTDVEGPDARHWPGREHFLRTVAELRMVVNYGFSGESGSACSHQPRKKNQKDPDE